MSSASNGPYHSVDINRLCRICGEFLARDRKRKFFVKDHIKDIKSAFWISDLEKDSGNPTSRRTVLTVL